MCGILGIIGKSPVKQRLIEGLKRLEYRGYDSSGIAILSEKKIFKRRAVGKMTALEEVLRSDSFDGNLGIGHTRWATHGGITEQNAHPHGNEDFVLVHNGIIENHEDLRLELEDYPFVTETDTEVIVHLINDEKKRHKNLEDVMMHVAKRLKGHFAIVLFLKDDPTTLVALRQGSPLVLGLSESEGFVGSDVLALSAFAKKFCYLENGDIAFVKKDSFRIIDVQGHFVERELKEINMPVYIKDRGTYAHYMLKEIYEQSTSIQDTFHNFKAVDLSCYDEIRIIACGTSFYAGCVAKYWFEMQKKIRTTVELASEFRYCKPLFHPKTCAIVISQSGETIDTLSCLYLLKEHKIPTLGIVNVRESSIARMVDHVIYTEAGLEVGVASTKAFTAQLMVLALLAKKDSHHELSNLPLKEILDMDWHEVASFLSEYSHVLFLGRGVSYPLALEGALKLKEISYIHAEGYAAGEMKHGPIALVDENLPIVCLAPFDIWFDKTLSNVQEVLARGATVILLTDEHGEKAIYHERIHKVILPCSSLWTSPFLYTLPLQLMAYYVALIKGTDIDQPRNLAKSVTVE